CLAGLHLNTPASFIMKLIMRSFSPSVVFACLTLPLFAQAPASTQTPATPPAQAPAASTSADTSVPMELGPKFRHFSFGFRVRGFPQNTMDDQSYFQTVPGSTVLTYSYATVSTQPRVGIGPSFELSLTRRLSLGVELLYNTVKYTKTTKI